MDVCTGKQIHTIGLAEFQALCSGYARVVVDIATGDGQFVYRLAQGHRDWLCIGVDPVQDHLAVYARKIYRKPGKGGLPNVLYVIASVGDLPPELDGRAQALHIHFPWGSLLQALLVGDAGVLANLVRLSAFQASLEMLINTSIFRDPIPLAVQGLPELTLGYIDRAMRPRYAEAGIVIVEHRAFSEQETRWVQTTWAKRLAHGKDPGTFYVRAEIMATPGGSRL